MNWHHFPSLAALRAFEATARLSGFSAAARELNVTHPAIAQHVRALEEHLGQALVFRQGRSMSLTPPGQMLAQSLTEGFQTMAQGIQAVQALTTDRPLKITATPSFVSNWLMPRLGDFWHKNPGAEVSLHPSADLVDLARDQIDVAIRYGDGNWPGTEVEQLFKANFVVVGSPKLVGDRVMCHPRDLSEMPWIVSAQDLESRHWLQGFGLEIDPDRITSFPSYDLVYTAIRSGYGLGVVSRELISEELATGQLKIMCKAEKSQAGYYIVTRKGIRSDAAKKFISWIKRAAKA